jgi:hypothetical protein
VKTLAFLNIIFSLFPLAAPVVGCIFLPSHKIIIILLQLKTEKPHWVAILDPSSKVIPTPSLPVHSIVIYLSFLQDMKLSVLSLNN